MILGDSEMGQVFGNILQTGALGALLWLIYYLFTKWLPARDKEHSDAMAAQRTDFKAEMGEERRVTEGLQETFRDALQLVSDRHKDQMQAMWIRIDQMTAMRDKRDEKITEAIDRAMDKKPADK